MSEPVTERLRLREMTASDAPFVHELMREPAFVENIGDRGIATVGDARRFIVEGPWRRGQPPGHGQRVVELRESGEPVGICGLLYRAPLDLTDVGFAILERHRRRGYAIEAAAALMRHGRDALGLATIYGLASPENLPSVRILEKLGLRFEKMVRLGRGAEEGYETGLFGPRREG